MLLGEHSAILLTFIKLPFIIMIFILSILSGCFTQVLLHLFAGRGEVINYQFLKNRKLNTRLLSIEIIKEEDGMKLYIKDEL